MKKYVYVNEDVGTTRKARLQMYRVMNNDVKFLGEITYDRQSVSGKRDVAVKLLAKLENYKTTSHEIVSKNVKLTELWLG
jgi:hypothetical protein